MSLEDDDPSSMVSSNPTKQLTMIVAATRAMGIGRNNELPWPRLKQEMGYFTRVTKRVPSTLSSSNLDRPLRNAVIMGRKTWDSIPPKNRPLQDRLNVVITSKPSSIVQELNGEDILAAASLEEAIQKLDADEQVARVFVIGGASIYAQALDRLPERSVRVLLTKIDTDYVCDTLFPIDLDGQEARKDGWKRQTTQELSEWVGEDMQNDGWKEDKGVKFQFCMFEKQP